MHPGALIAGRYLVEAQLGAGALGVVLRAKDERLRRVVAVKVVTPAAVGNPHARARLLREARAVAALEHPGIVRLYDVGETPDGGAFLVMELVRGRSLRQALDEGTLSLQQRVSLVNEIAQALLCAHQNGIVHRDVKPDNIMIRDNGHAVVLDFGVAKSFTTDAGIDREATSVTRAGALVGTPYYLAPEQAIGDKIDARADQFALAVTAYQMLTGRLPWSSEGLQELLVEIVTRECVPPSHIVPVLPKAVDGVMARGLAKRPTNRFPDIEAFARAFEQALAGPLPPGPPIDMSDRTIPLMQSPGSPASSALSSPSTVPLMPVAKRSTPPPNSALPTARPLTESQPTKESLLTRGPPQITPEVIAQPEKPPMKQQANAGGGRDPSPPSKPKSEPAGKGGPTPQTQNSASQSPLTQSSPKPTARGRLDLATRAAAALSAVLLIGVAVLAWRRAHVARENAAGPLLQPDSVFACPPLQASGVDEPTGWLGAAAATLVCTRAQVVLGGSSTRTLSPAELLTLPKVPRDDFPVDPYALPDARDRALAAAKARAGAYLDGEVTMGADVSVTLSIRASSDGRQLEQAEGRGATLLGAVRAAMDGLTGGLALPHLTQPSPVLTEWTRVPTVDAALVLTDLEIAFTMEEDPEPATECSRALARMDARDGLTYAAWGRCSAELRAPWPPAKTGPLDRSTPGALLASITAQDANALGATQARSFADLLLETWDHEPTKQGEALLATEASFLMRLTGDTASERNLALASVQADPKLTDLRGSGWSRLAMVAPDPQTGPAYAAWCPWAPEAHLLVAELVKDPDAKLSFGRRAFVLAPHGMAGLRFGELLLAEGKRADARAVVVKTNSRQLELEVGTSEGRFAAALRDARNWFAAVPADTKAYEEAFTAVPITMDASMILGRKPDVPMLLAARYLGETTSHIKLGTTPLRGLLLTCTLAPDPFASNCLATLQTLLSQGQFLYVPPSFAVALLGAESFIVGDYAGAAKTWGPLVVAGGEAMEQLRHPMAIAFDRNGDLDLADQVDAVALGSTGRYNGADPAYVRGALRAEKRGDRERARKLAQAVIDAWSTADEASPSVADMKRLLARLK
jgi:serine/threonine protein kinase